MRDGAAPAEQMRRRVPEYRRLGRQEKWSPFASGIGLNTEAGTDVTKTLAPAAPGEAAKKAAEKNP